MCLSASTVTCLGLILELLTLVAVVWYAFLTYGILRSSRRQVQEMIDDRRLALMPSLLGEVVDAGPSLVLSVRNIGNGAAIDVRIEPFTAWDPMPAWYFDPIAFLDRREHLPVIVRAGSGARAPDVGPYDLSAFEARSTAARQTLHVSFKDIEGRRYQQELYLGQGGYSSSIPQRVQ